MLEKYKSPFRAWDTRLSNGNLWKSEAQGDMMLDMNKDFFFFKLGYMYKCKWLTVIHPEDNRRGQPSRGPALQHEGDPNLHRDVLILLLWPQGGPCKSQTSSKVPEGFPELNNTFILSTFVNI